MLNPFVDLQRNCTFGKPLCYIMQPNLILLIPFAFLRKNSLKFLHIYPGVPIHTLSQLLKPIVTLPGISILYQISSSLGHLASKTIHSPNNSTYLYHQYQAYSRLHQEAMTKKTQFISFLEELTGREPNCCVLFCKQGHTAPP